MLKLGLGTAQFGLDYGVSNRIGKTSAYDVAEIIKLARNKGIRILDTAQAYGDSEKVLGEIGVENFDVITKISKKESLQDSLKNLRLQSVYGLLAHNAEELIESRELWNRFKNYKEQGLTKKIGVSVYNSYQIDEILSKYSIDIIQLPINIYDQRLIISGHLKELKKRNVEIHARSAFLQGVLLMSSEDLPSYFSNIKSHHTQYIKFITENKLSLVQASLGFVNKIVEVDNIICGLSSLAQLTELVTSKLKIKDLDFTPYLVDNINILNPAYWDI